MAKQRQGWKVAWEVGTAAGLEGSLAASQGRGEITFLEGIKHLSEAVAHLEQTLEEWVRDARTEGHSWTEIGDALGMAKQSAWERFSE